MEELACPPVIKTLTLWKKYGISTKRGFKDVMYIEEKADRVVNFIKSLKQATGKWFGISFDLMLWQEKIIRELFGTVN